MTHWTPSFSCMCGRRCVTSNGVFARICGRFFLCWVAFGRVFFALRSDRPIWLLSIKRQQCLAVQ